MRKFPILKKVGRTIVFDVTHMQLDIKYYHYHKSKLRHTLHLIVYTQHLLKLCGGQSVLAPLRRSDNQPLNYQPRADKAMIGWLQSGVAALVI